MMIHLLTYTLLVIFSYGILIISSHPESVVIEVEEKKLLQLPEIFQSDFLPLAEFLGDPDFRYIDPLGLVQVLVPKPSIVTPDSFFNVNHEPESPYKTDTVFYIYDHGSIKELPFKETTVCAIDDECDIYPLQLTRLLDTIDIRKRSVLIIGGYRNKAPNEWQKIIADRYQKTEDVNTIIVGWNNANQGLYGQAIINTRIVSRQITVFLYYLAKVNNLDFKSAHFLNKIHLIGHSLGAHISGFVGKDFAGRLGRITGLDAAGPSFSDATRENRLDSSDAVLVDAYHTNGNIGVGYYLGILKHVAHIDYYPNGGERQTGSANLDIKFSHEIIRYQIIGSLDYQMYIHKKLGENKRMRLLAFASPVPYADFLKGSSFVLTCPKLAYDLSNDLASINEATDELEKCAIQIDVTSDPNERLNELKTQLGDDLDTYYGMNYYYSTRADDPYLMDSQLIKIRFAPSNQLLTRTKSQPSKKSKAMSGSISTPSTDSHEYNVTLKLEMLNGSMQKKQYINYKLHQNEYYYHLVAPIEPSSHYSKYALVDLEANNYFQEFPSKRLEVLTEIFPIYLSISLINKQSRLGRTFSLNPRKWPPFHQPGEQSNQADRDCLLLPNAVRIQPLSNLSRLLIGIYTTERHQPEPRRPRIIKLDDNEPFPNISMGYVHDCITQSQWDTSYEFYLNTIVIGPKRRNH